MALPGSSRMLGSEIAHDGETRLSTRKGATPESHRRGPAQQLTRAIVDRPLAPLNGAERR